MLRIVSHGKNKTSHGALFVQYENTLLDRLQYVGQVGRRIVGNVVRKGSQYSVEGALCWSSGRTSETVFITATLPASGP